MMHFIKVFTVFQEFLNIKYIFMYRIRGGWKISGEGVQIYKGGFILSFLPYFHRSPHKNKIIWSKSGWGVGIRENPLWICHCRLNVSLILESAVFYFCGFPLFLKVPSFEIISVPDSFCLCYLSKQCKT